MSCSPNMILDFRAPGSSEMDEMMTKKSNLLDFAETVTEEVNMFLWYIDGFIDGYFGCCVQMWYQVWLRSVVVFKWYQVWLRYQPYDYGYGDGLEQFLGQEYEPRKSPVPTEIDPPTPMLPDNQLGMEDTPPESPCTSIVPYTGAPSASPPPESWFVMRLIYICRICDVQWWEQCT